MIHSFKIGDDYMVLDANSGAVHEIDRMIYDMLPYMEKGQKDEMLQELPYPKEELLEAASELEALKAEGLLFTEDDYKDIAKGFESSDVVKALCLHIAHDCNLRCKYCFAETGSFHGSRSMMSVEVGKAAIDFAVAKSQNRRNIEIDFFGGEPLMNFDTVREIVAYAEEQGKLHGKNFRFTLTTNGMLLNEEIEAFLNEKMSNVVLSLDGRKEVNDRMRPRVDGSGTYDRIVPKFQHFTKLRGDKDYFVRGTFTHENLNFAEDVLHMASLGFDKLSMEPVVGEETEPYAIREEDLPTLYEEYEKLAKAYLDAEEQGKRFHFFHFEMDLKGGPCISKRLKGCGSGSEYLAVTPEGDLYPCHQFVGREEYRMGSVLDGTFDIEKSKVFRKHNVYSSETCKNCWARFYCSGGCVANALSLGGGMDKPYEIGCALMKKRIECALWIYAKRQEKFGN